MKLEPKAKPVKIRIKSGGEEHSSLDSLKRNFSVEDLKPLQKDGRLSRWLRQLNENELAEKIEKIDLENLTVSSYVCFLKSFFDDLPDDISRICDYWLIENPDYHENGIRLLQFRLNDSKNCDIDEVVRLKDKYAEYAEEVNVDWIDIFKKRTDECDDEAKLLNLGSMFYKVEDDKPLMQYGQELLEKLELKGNNDAKELLNSNRDITEKEMEKIIELTNKYEIDKGFEYYDINRCLKSCHSKKSKAVIGLYRCITSIIKDSKKEQPLSNNHAISHFDNEDEYFHNEMLFLETLLKLCDVKGADGLYYPLTSNKQNKIFNINYDKRPSIIEEIESGKFGIGPYIDLCDILAELVVIILDEIKLSNKPANNLNDSSANVAQKTPSINKRTDVEYCQVRFISKAKSRFEAAIIIRKFYETNISVAMNLVKMAPCKITWELKRNDAITMIKQLDNCGTKACIIETT